MEQVPEPQMKVPPNTPADNRIAARTSRASPTLQHVASQTPPPTPPPQSNAPVFVQRVSALPLVACTIQAYNDARQKGDVLSLGILCSEIAVGLATLPVRAVLVPLAMICPLPVRVADKLMCLWLDCVEMLAPCIKGPPRKMCRPVRICYRTSRNKLKAIPGLAWMTTDELFTTPCGRLLMTSADRLIISVDGCVDLILPSPDSPDAGRLARLIGNLARIPSRTARSVYESLYDLMQYVSQRAEAAKEAAATAKAIEAAAAAARHKRHAQQYCY